MTISAPAKPPATSAQRSGETRSCSSVAASTVTITGVSIVMAVNSATGRYCRPKKPKVELSSRSRPRTAWKRGCAELKPAPPRRDDTASHSAITPACTP